jgi:twitching motility protein PilT
MDYEKELEKLIQNVISENASDLHLSEGRSPSVRVSGELIPLSKWAPLSKEDTFGFLTVLLRPEDKEMFLEKKEMDFPYDYVNKARFRGNVYFQRGAVSIALRLIPRTVKSIEELNLPPVLADFAAKKQGFFLVVGPVGQGKTTTLASMIELINSTRSEHILTIEDPIEYVFDQKKSIVDQREVRVDTTDFQTALKSMFRQDINVTMIGEMRGPETISTAVSAAETGHLVLSTLHTNNASQTVERIIDSFPPNGQNQIRAQLAGSLMGIFSQRLIPRISGGMIPAYELLINNKAVANLIREGRTHEIDAVIETSSGRGMISMNRSLIELVRKGEITLENAKLRSLSPQLLDKML